MHNNTENSGAPLEETAQAAQQESSPETPETAHTAQEAPAASTPSRKNGRNRRSGKKSSASGASCDTSTCGMVEDIVSVSEKLSGKHIDGYSGREKSTCSTRRYEHEEKVEAIEAQETVVAEDAEDAKEFAEVEDEFQSEGPQFDTSNSPKAIEVGLGNGRGRRPRSNGQEGLKRAEISYSESGMNAPKEGLIAKIKRMLSSIFSSEKKPAQKGRSFDKNRRRQRGADKNFRRHDGKEGGNRNRPRGGKGGNRRHNSRRPQGGGRPHGHSGGGSPKGSE